MPSVPDTIRATLPLLLLLLLLVLTHLATTTPLSAQSPAPPIILLPTPRSTGNMSTTTTTGAQRAPFRGTVALEEAVLDPAGMAWIGDYAPFFYPNQDPAESVKQGYTPLLRDIHASRLRSMDAHGVEYMLLSLTSPGAQGEPDRARAARLAREANDWLAAEVTQNPARFGGFASVSLHDAHEAAAEAERAVRELGMFGVMVNDYQVVDAGGDPEGKKYFDEEEYWPFWQKVEELGVPVYLHPRYPPLRELRAGYKYGERKELLGASVQFHLDLSMHVYALCVSGLFDRFPGLKVVVGHLGEG